MRATLAVMAVLVSMAVAAPAEAWSYKDAAKPYAGQSITILDEITPLQETMKTLVPEFVKETGIKVDYQLLNHFEVISKGQADMLSGRGAYDGVMVHSPQMGLLLAGRRRPAHRRPAREQGPHQPRSRPRTI